MFSGSLVALITPMRVDGALDLDSWRTVLDLHLASGTAGVVVAGSTGESVALTDEEIQTLVNHAVEHVGGRIKVIVGAGMSSTARTVERARQLSTLGVDALLVVTPAYNRPTQQGLYQHFKAIAAASRVPVILYNVPSRTAVDLLPETVAKLAQLPGICGLKEAVADIARIRDLIARCPPDFTVLSGDDPTAQAAIFAGARGVISVTANVAPQLFADMVAAALRGDRAQADSLSTKLQALNRDLFVESNPIPAKWALQELGMIQGGIRLPLTPLSVQHRDTVRAAMRAADLLPQALRRSV